MRQISTDAQGNTTAQFYGRQSSLQADIEPVTQSWSTQTSTVTANGTQTVTEHHQTQWQDDTHYQTTTTTTSTHSTTNASTTTQTTTQYQIEEQDASGLYTQTAHVIGSTTTELQSTGSTTGPVSTNIFSTQLQNLLDNNQALDDEILQAAQIRSVGNDESWRIAA